MKQQVKLAMAIATDCPYLILDEPLNGLDPGKRKTSCDAMRSEVARGRSVLISSHLLDDLADLTNSFYFIEAGTLVEKIKSSSQTDVYKRQGCSCCGNGQRRKDNIL